MAIFGILTGDKLAIALRKITKTCNNNVLIKRLATGYSSTSVLTAIF
jgi:hypothetical protein